MLVRAWRFITLMLAALTMAMGFCHLMEMPVRMRWDQSLWVGSTVRGNLYHLFGTIGAGIVVATVLATAILAFLVRRREPLVFRLSVGGAALFALALAGWWALVFPANVELATWAAGDVPADWTRWRARWEYGHAFDTVLQLAGLAALLLSVLVETPAQDRPGAEEAGARPERLLRA